MKQMNQMNQSFSGDENTGPVPSDRYLILRGMKVLHADGRWQMADGEWRMGVQ